MDQMERPDECKWQTPGMAYVPWQNFTRAYDPKQALQAGTIFPELDKPFTEKCMMRKEDAADEPTESRTADESAGTF